MHWNRSGRPRFEARSYGFRPGRSCADAIGSLYSTLNGTRAQRVWILDADLSAAFDRIDHARLLDALDGFPARGTIECWLRAGRTEKRHDSNGHSYPWIVKTTRLVNHFYFYCVDCDFGPFFLKFCSYFPYNAKLCLNSNEWAKRQATKAGIGFTALDNGFAVVDDPAAVQAMCDELGPDQIDGLLRRWLAVLPHPRHSSTSPQSGPIQPLGACHQSSVV